MTSNVMQSPVLPILDMNQAAVLPPVVRSRFALRRSPDAGHADVWALVPADITRGLFDSSGDWLTDELRSTATLPRLVTIDFTRTEASQREIARIVAKLASWQIGTSVRTNVVLEPVLLEELQEHRDLVHVTVVVASLDPSVQQALDPPGAMPAERLATITALAERGVPVAAAIEPLLPDCSDSPDQLQALLEALAASGVVHVTAGYLVIHDDERPRLEAALEPLGLLEPVTSAYSDGPLLRDGGEMARYLSKSRRQRGYASLIALGAALGVSVRLSGRLNPDFRPARVELPHHLRSLQQTFRERMQPVRDADAVGA